MTSSSRRIECRWKLSSIWACQILVFWTIFRSKAWHGQHWVYGPKTTLKWVHNLAMAQAQSSKLIFKKFWAWTPAPPPLKRYKQASSVAILVISLCFTDGKLQCCARTFYCLRMACLTIPIYLGSICHKTEHMSSNYNHYLRHQKYKIHHER